MKQQKNPELIGETTPRHRKGALTMATALLSMVLVGGATRADNEPTPTIEKGADATATAIRKETVFVGDSIIWGLCEDDQEYIAQRCEAFPGVWVSAADGSNLLARFIEQANLESGDTLVLSSISSFLPEGITREEVVQRLRDLHDELMAKGIKLVVVVAPEAGFPLCNVGESGFTPEAYYALPTEAQTIVSSPESWEEGCKTLDEVAAVQANEWTGATIVRIPGPFEPDGIHPTDDVGKPALVSAIMRALTK